MLMPGSPALVLIASHAIGLLLALVLLSWQLVPLAWLPAHLSACRAAQVLPMRQWQLVPGTPFVVDRFCNLPVQVGDAGGTAHVGDVLTGAGVHCAMGMRF